MKAFLIDIDRCVGCHDCQIGCKDEHCDQCWAPYAEAQPEIGQFWMKLNEYERGKRPHVKVTYLPIMCQHCKEAPCMKAAKDGAVYRRDDGLVIIDPIKSKGQRQIVDSCPYHAVFWNEELNIPQKCTGCAHLIDGGHALSVPRCVDNCHMDVIKFGEEEELDLDGAEYLHPEYGTKPRVYYKGLPKRFVAGLVYDPNEKEVVVGAKVTLIGDQGVFTGQTDDWGDFWLRNLPEGSFSLTIEKDGKIKSMDVDTSREDVGLGEIALA